ncbi:MAG TPA: hypothetical protein VEA81_08545, partial [Burkholderiaceae bacterium]|nr:hypothetical protein [Burkholderiaceae bacterium]
MSASDAAGRTPVAPRRSRRPERLERGDEPQPSRSDGCARGLPRAARNHAVEPVPKFDTSAFIVISRRVENGEDRPGVSNRVARSVIESVRG